MPNIPRYITVVRNDLESNKNNFM